jgi:hypothetical protein
MAGQAREKRGREPFLCLKREDLDEFVREIGERLGSWNLGILIICVKVAGLLLFVAS